MNASKERKLEEISFALLRNYSANPLKKMNVRKTARDHGVSPAWIYKYMGNEPSRILLSAIDVLAPLITELGTPLKPVKSREEWIRAFFRGLNKTLIEVETFPDLYRFYFVTCMKETSELRERIKHHEHLFLTHRVLPRIQSAFRCSRAEAKSFGNILMQLRMGLVFHWLTESKRTPAKRRLLLKEVRKSVFDWRK